MDTLVLEAPPTDTLYHEGKVDPIIEVELQRSIHTYFPVPVRVFIP